MMDHAGLVLLAKYTATKDCQVWGRNIELSNSVDCQSCAQGGYDCEGYATRLHWNTSASDGIVIIGITSHNSGKWRLSSKTETIINKLSSNKANTGIQYNLH